MGDHNSERAEAEAAVRCLKEMIKKSGAVRGQELDCKIFEFNSMARSDGSVSPIEIFLGRNVNGVLLNQGQIFDHQKGCGEAKEVSSTLDGDSWEDLW